MLGASVWLAGWAINLHSDHILRNLRKPGETGAPFLLNHIRAASWGSCFSSLLRVAHRGYKIPRGGAFGVVSGANYFGEIVEWAGFAVAAWTLPAAAFAFFTFSNLAPRAHHHHKWYQAKFQDYPMRRKAVIPGLW
jgi:hypothetical protein